MPKRQLRLLWAIWASRLFTLANKKSQLSPDQVRTNLTTVFRKYFDMPTIGRFVLGQYWRNASPAQQQEYQKLFEAMAVSVYTQRFNQYAGQNLQVVSSEPTSGSQDTLVKTTITGDQPFQVDWRVRPIGNSFKVVDVIVENVSMSITQRSDFSAVIEKSGGNIEGLLVDMRRRVATGQNAQQD